MVGIADGPDVGMGVGSSEGARLGSGDGPDVGAAVVGVAVGTRVTVGSIVVGAVVVGTAVGCGDHASEFGNAESTNQPLLQGASLPSPQLAS